MLIYLIVFFIILAFICANLNKHSKPHMQKAASHTKYDCVQW